MENKTEEKNDSFKFDNLIFDSRYALSDKDLTNWCSANNLDCGIIELKSLNLEALDKRQNFIFTGAKDDEYNKSNDHHWLAQDGNLIFDSYGAYNEYKLPENFEYFQTNPKRLQEYNTTVCGAYCCAFLAFINKQNPTSSLSDLGQEFVSQYELGNDRKENDKTIIEWYIQTGGNFEDPSKPITIDTSGDRRTDGANSAPSRDLNRADPEINVGTGERSSSLENSNE